MMLLINSLKQKLIEFRHACLVGWEAHLACLPSDLYLRRKENGDNRFCTAPWLSEHLLADEVGSPFNQICLASKKDQDNSRGYRDLRRELGKDECYLEKVSCLLPIGFRYREVTVVLLT